MQRMTGQRGTIHRRTLFLLICVSVLVLAMALFAVSACRSRSPLDDTIQHIDLVATLPWAEAWGPVERIDLGTGDHGLITLDGLYFAEREPDGRTYAWSWGEETSFLLACPAVRPRVLAISCRRLAVPQLEDLRVEVLLNGTGLDTFTPGTEYSDWVIEAPAAAWKQGDNLLALRYSEDVYLPDVVPGIRDTRRVAVQLDAIRIITEARLDDDVPPVTVEGDQLLLPGPTDVSWHLEILPGSMLAFDCSAEMFDRLRITVGTEGEAPVEVVPAGIGSGRQVNRYAVDLGPWAGRYIRLTVSVIVEDRLSGTGARPVVHLLRPEIRVPEPEPAPAPASAPKRPAGPAPDVLVYVMDALRADNLSSYGYARRTSPVLDRLTRRGLLFRNAFAQAPNTGPSVKSIFTGRFLPFTEYTVLSEDHPTLAETYARAGYATGLFSNNPNLGSSVGFHRGFEHVANEILFSRKPVKDFARQATSAFIDWAGTVPPDRPLFAYVHTIHPHNPYEAPVPFDQAFGPVGSRGPQVDLSTEALLEYAHGERWLKDDVLQRMRDYYDGDILYNDLELGRLLAWLVRSGRDRETVIAFTADHGEELADHGGLLHGFTLYDEQIRVPLVLVNPSAEVGVVAEHVRLVDLAPTLYDLAGLEDQPTVEGETLAGAIGEREIFSSASSAKGLYTLRSGRWKYVHAPRTRHLWGMGEGLGRTRELHYLFDLEADPGEQKNLADERQVTRKALQARLLEWVEAQAAQEEEGSAGSERPELDEETRQRLLDLGYITE